MKKVIKKPLLSRMSSDEADAYIRAFIPMKEKCYHCNKFFIADTWEDFFVYTDKDFPQSLWVVCPHCGNTTCVKIVNDPDILKASTIRRRTMLWSAFVRPFLRPKAEAVYETDQ